uniref:Syntaxin N-terminal domain-containing protein n=1 Tax=Meloidogyne javanica TaxID=6303 RepID=A0A915N7F2_MELJA
MFSFKQLKARPSLRSPTELSVSGLTNNLHLGRNDYFLQQISQMNSCLDEIDHLIKQMLQVQQIILCRTISEPQDKHQLDFIINQFRKLVGELRTNLQKLEFEQQQEKSLNLTSNATQRINLNQVEQLKRRLCQILEKFQKSREDYRQRVTIKRQLELAGEPLNQEDVEHLLEEKSEQIFYRNINPMNVAAHLALEEASDRHNELVKLEKSIGELNDCFGDMLALVHSQVGFKEV